MVIYGAEINHFTLTCVERGFKPTNFHFDINSSFKGAKREKQTKNSGKRLQYKLLYMYKVTIPPSNRMPEFRLI